MKTISSIVLLAGLALFLNGQEPNLIKNLGVTALMRRKWFNAGKSFENGWTTLNRRLI